MYFSLNRSFSILASEEDIFLSLSIVPTSSFLLPFEILDIPVEDEALERILFDGDISFPSLHTLALVLGIGYQYGWCMSKYWVGGICDEGPTNAEVVAWRAPMGCDKEGTPLSTPRGEHTPHASPQMFGPHFGSSGHSLLTRLVIS